MCTEIKDTTCWHGDRAHIEGQSDGIVQVDVDLLNDIKY